MPPLPSPSPALPGWSARYTPRHLLGRGGGGEVWEVEDAVDGRSYALKVLAPGAPDEVVEALVRECAMQAGLEGLGVPRVHRLGRLPDGRMFLLRDQVAGPSLGERLKASVPASEALGALLDVTSLLTRLHRAGVVHGDLKPDNLLLDGARPATLVDLGLASRWQGGAAAPGLTPGFDAPELRTGAAPSPRTDVFALGATLRAVLAAVDLPASERRALGAIADRACAADPASRWPSADEMEAALRAVLGRPPAPGVGLSDAVWPIVERPVLAASLHAALDSLAPGQTLVIEGRAGAGKTTALRRLAWTLGAAGQRVAWVEGPGAARALALELVTLGSHMSEAVLLIDDAGQLDADARTAIDRALGAGARLVVTSGAGLDWTGPSARTVPVPPLDPGEAGALVRRGRPSLSEAVVGLLVARAAGRPGRLRALAARLGDGAIVSVAEAERLLDPVEARAAPGDARGAAERAAWWLDRGRLGEAAAALAAAGEPASVRLELARVRLAIAQGDAPAATARLDALEASAGDTLGRIERRVMAGQRARVALLLGRYDEASERAREVLADGASGSEEVEAWACIGVAESLRGRHEAARPALAEALAAARRDGDRRGEALALSSLAMARQRRGETASARAAYEQALEAAEEASDAAAVATIRLNLAALAGPDELGLALAHLEAAVDLGQRAGRTATVRQARLNLASLDLSLGRLARARHTLAALRSERHTLGDAAAAQLLGLEASLAAREGDEQAAALYERCAAAYDRLGRAVDAAEARLEAVLVASARPGLAPAAVESSLGRVRAALADDPTHRAPLLLAEGLVALGRDDEPAARRQLAAALEATQASGQRDWRWQVLAARARLEQRSGRLLAARHDAEQALALLEDGAAPLPPDLREVYWSDPRRAAVRALAVVEPARPAPSAHSRLDERLERILEINRDLAGVRALPALLERVLHHAVALLDAARGHVLLVDAAGQLGVRASFGLGADEDHRSFSRSIAARAIATGEPVVTASALDDERLREHASVHRLALRSVVCVPIRSPAGGAIGALHLEPRSLAPLSDRDLVLVRAFADQAAIALEGARLLDENERRASELAAANRELSAAQERLRELLDHRQAQLASTRRDLKDTRAVLRGHFGYQGLVGTSAAMRRIYALIDRVSTADVPALLTGESGTGKEMVARALHEASPRKGRPFTAINCGAIPENLLESELFGHVKGAFTGADRERRGLLRDSDGGTVLLDEIGEMPPRMQAALLRVLQEHTVRPVGGVREEPIDVRIIAATHRDLAEMVRAGTFREDLYFRLHVVEIALPPLRERLDDIPALVDHFLTLFAARHRRERGTVSREALRRLATHDWPGNVRQLQNVLLNAWVLADGPELGPDDLDLPSPRPPSQPSFAPASVPPREALPSSLSDHRNAEKERILAALQASNWNRLKAAQLLAIPRRTFYRRLRDYGIQ